MNRLISPPLFGIFLANSTNEFAAVAEAAITPGSIPATVSAYFLILCPKGTNSSPNLVNELPPVNHETIPSNTFAAVSAIIDLVSA